MPNVFAKGASLVATTGMLLTACAGAVTMAEVEVTGAKTQRKPRNLVRPCRSGKLTVRDDDSRGFRSDISHDAPRSTRCVCPLLNQSSHHCLKLPPMS